MVGRTAARGLHMSDVILPIGSQRSIVVVIGPLPKDGGMAEDHEAPEAGQLPRAWTRGRRETLSRQRVSSAKSP